VADNSIGDESLLRLFDLSEDAITRRLRALYFVAGESSTTWTLASDEMALMPILSRYEGQLVGGFGKQKLVPMFGSTPESARAIKCATKLKVWLAVPMNKGSAVCVGLCPGDAASDEEMAVNAIFIKAVPGNSWL
jgi:hypothetical protein